MPNPWRRITKETISPVLVMVEFENFQEKSISRTSKGVERHSGKPRTSEYREQSNDTGVRVTSVMHGIC
jgi:hypothetical protein